MWAKSSVEAHAAARLHGAADNHNPEHGEECAKEIHYGGGVKHKTVPMNHYDLGSL